MHLRPLVVILVLLWSATALAGKKTKPSWPVCTSAHSCARACDARHAKACDRLALLLDHHLEERRGGYLVGMEPAVLTRLLGAKPVECAL